MYMYKTHEDDHRQQNCLFCVQNSFKRPIASVSNVHQPVRVVLVPPPVTVCSVPPALLKSSTMTDLREL